MTDAYVIEMHSRAAGVAVRDRRGFRFFAAAEPFFALDKRLFPHLRAVRRAVGTIAAQLEAHGERARRTRHSASHASLRRTGFDVDA